MLGIALRTLLNHLLLTEIQLGGHYYFSPFTHTITEAQFAAAAAAKSLQSCPTLCDPIDSSPPGSPVPDSPGKNTGVGCHFLLQCMKVKSLSHV